MRPFIKSFNTEADTADSFSVTICATDSLIATVYAKKYFGDASVDTRNKNRVTLAHSDDAEGEYTFQVYS